MLRKIIHWMAENGSAKKGQKLKADLGLRDALKAEQGVYDLSKLLDDSEAQFEERVQKFNRRVSDTDMKRKGVQSGRIETNP